MFYQLVYLRGSSANILLNGNPTLRHAFFEKIFRLEDYDYVAQELRKRLKKLQTKQIQLDTLQSEFKKPKHPKKHRVRATELERLVDQLQRRQRKAAAAERAAGIYTELVKQLPAKYRDPKRAKRRYQQARQDFERLLELEFACRDNQTAWEATANTGNNASTTKTGY